MTFASLGLDGKKVLLVASAGGHFSEMCRIHPQLGLDPRSALVTFRSPQTQMVSWPGRVDYIPHIGSRDVRGTVRAYGFFRRLLREQQWDAVVSTGAAVALAALPVASAAGVRSLYVESYARFDGPSTTGRILARSPFDVELYTQHSEWADRSWTYAGSVLDTLRPAQSVRRNDYKRWFVTLGTIEPYRFDALVDAVLASLPRGADVVWQLGCTGRNDLPGRVYSYLDAELFALEATAADVVISHAGAGTAMELIEMGHRPIIVPRRAHRREHVDDHQTQIAANLAASGFARSCEPTGLAAVLRRVAREAASSATWRAPSPCADDASAQSICP